MKYGNNAAACCTKRIIGITWAGFRFGQVAAPLPAQRRSAYGERNADAPPGRALGDLYGLGNEIVKIVKKASVFGHSVAEKAP